METLPEVTAAALTRVQDQLLKAPKDLTAEEIVDPWDEIARFLSMEQVVKYDSLWTTVKGCGLTSIVCESMRRAMEVDTEVRALRCCIQRRLM